MALTVSGTIIPQSSLDTLAKRSGKRFEAGNSVLTTSWTTFDPALIKKRDLSQGLAFQGLRNIQQSRQDTIGDPNTFVERRTQGLRDAIEESRIALGERLDKTGVQGEFGQQSKENFAANAERKIATGELLALQEVDALQGNFDLMEGGAAELLNKIDINQFVQEMEARGLSQELTSKLRRLAQGQNALSDAASQKKKETVGRVLMIGASILSSRTFKHDMKSLNNQQILDAMMELNVEKWKYKGESEEHIGCYAEDFNERFGIEGEKTINVVDIIGVLMASVQAQQKQIEELKGDT